MRVLYDGWSLVRNPVSPSSLHLLAILENLPEEIESLLVLPEASPGWLTGINAHVQPTANTPLGRWLWEQVRVPGLANQFKADLLHLMTPTAPLISSSTILYSPCYHGAGMEDPSVFWRRIPDSNLFLNRLRSSFAQGGMAQVSEIVWPQDVPHPPKKRHEARIPPVLPSLYLIGPGEQGSTNRTIMHTLSREKKDYDLPESFILYHGPGDQGSLVNLLNAWRWAAEAIGGLNPLVVVGLDRQEQAIAAHLVEEYALGVDLHILPIINPIDLAWFYRACVAVFHPAPTSPWAGPVRLALAHGKPLVASENTISDAIAGPAAYLAPAGDGRALGAALVTVIVEEQFAGEISASALKRSAAWRATDIGEQLLGRYQLAQGGF